MNDSADALIESSGLERRDAEILLAAAWKIPRSAVLVRGGDTVPAPVAARFRELAARRAAGEPVAYLLGRREFWSMPLDVNAAVLVPRPETELLVERVLGHIGQAPARVADLGTGSGAIALALAHERPAWRICATDASREALEVARGNGERLAPGRIEWLRGDSFDDWFSPLTGRFDAIASNPPYVAADDAALLGDGLRFEPRTALTPGGDGFAALNVIVDGAPEYLAPGGWLVLEHGTAQAEPLRARLVARGFTHVTSHRDLAGHERVTEGQWPQR